MPPSGPAIPVTEQATSAPKRSRAPSAIASATSGETAPWRSISPASTPSSSTLASFEYATTPPLKYSEAPGRSVRRPASSPAVQDSATATVRPSSRFATTSSIVSPASL